AVAATDELLRLVRRRVSLLDRVSLRCVTNLVCFALGLGYRLSSLGTRTENDLVGCFMRVLQDLARLFTDLCDVVPDGRLPGRRDLELSDHAIDLLDVTVDRGALATTNAERKPHFARLLD